MAKATQKPEPIAQDVAVWQAARLRELSDTLKKLETELADMKDERKSIIEQIRDTNAAMRSVIDDGPGRARHFWLDRGRKVQPECECKRTEETVVEPDGYRWQRPKGGQDVPKPLQK